jgi:hypothetical protein
MLAIACLRHPRDAEGSKKGLLQDRDSKKAQTMVSELSNPYLANAAKALKF